jgi:phosphonate transport system substrate-binding protein
VAAAGKPCLLVDLPAVVSAVQTYEAWAPFLAEVSRRSGVCLTPRAASGFSQAQSRLRLGESDFAVPTPPMLVGVRARIAYEPLLVDRARRIRGVMVVPAESAVHDISDLRDVRLGVPAEDSYLASLVPQRLLKRAGVRCRLAEFGTMSNVLYAVAAGRVEVGASIDLVLKEQRPEVRQKLRVIHVTRDFLPPPLAAHPRVSHEVREKVVAAILAMQADAEGRRWLSAVHLEAPQRIGFEAYQAEWGGLKRSAAGCKGDH